MKELEDVGQLLRDKEELLYASQFHQHEASTSR